MTNTARPADADTRLSKLLAFWLRHDPGAGGLALDPHGWAEVAAVLRALERELGRPVALAELERLVQTSDKQRFALADGRIRANQGHSITVDLGLQPVAPPAVLFHGTTQERWAQIQRSVGLAKMQRQHVHLSPDQRTAERVAARHRGQTPLVLRVDAAAMGAAGVQFFRSANGVYLVEAVPLRYLTVHIVDTPPQG